MFLTSQNPKKPTNQPKNPNKQNKQKSPTPKPTKTQETTQNPALNPSLQRNIMSQMLTKTKFIKSFGVKQLSKNSCKNQERTFFPKNIFPLFFINIIFMHSILLNMQSKMFTLSASEAGKYFHQNKWLKLLPGSKHFVELFLGPWKHCPYRKCVDHIILLLSPQLVARCTKLIRNISFQFY